MKHTVRRPLPNRAVVLDHGHSGTRAHPLRLVNEVACVIGLALAIGGGAMTVSCTDDDGRTGNETSTGAGGSGGSDSQNGAGGGGRIGSPGGGAGGGHADGTGGMPWTDNCFEAGWGGLPISRDDDDKCLVCLAQNCCHDLAACGGTGAVEDDAGASRQTFSCYDRYFPCTRNCYDRETATDSSTDSEAILLACGDECALRKVDGSSHFDLRDRDLLGCMSGGPRLVVDGTKAKFVKVEPDSDAGASVPNCLAECLPSWR